MNVDSDNQLSGQIIGAAIVVHRELGPGLEERVYEAMFSTQLAAHGIRHVCQAPLPLRYKGIKLECGYRIDLWVENRLAVEIKSVETVLPIHDAQLLTYLRLTPCDLGLLINFDVPVLRQGVRRRVWTAAAGQAVGDSPDDHAGLHEFEPLSREVLAAAAEVHRELGPGLLRSTYEECLCYELAVRGIAFERKKLLPARCRDVEIPAAVEIPLLVAGELPVMCLSVLRLTPLHHATLLARLKQGDWKSGLLINFNVTGLRKGIRRVVN